MKISVSTEKIGCLNSGSLRRNSIFQLYDRIFPRNLKIFKTVFACSFVAQVESKRKKGRKSHDTVPLNNKMKQFKFGQWLSRVIFPIAKKHFKNQHKITNLLYGTHHDIIQAICQFLIFENQLPLLYIVQRTRTHCSVQSVHGIGRWGTKPWNNGISNVFGRLEFHHWKLDGLLLVNQHSHKGTVSRVKLDNWGLGERN